MNKQQKPADAMKKFFMEYVIVPIILVGPLVLLGVIIYDGIQHKASLKFACETLGGVYVDSEICIDGKNLFVGELK
jgi:hypothetical protein